MPWGSSPRGRGKQYVASAMRKPNRLIPAWAGKTGRGDTPYRRQRAHPRVGGENPRMNLSPGLATGSSPRGRGKLARALHLEADRGLIPAWAGKTDSCRRTTAPVAAHPRVGGENEVAGSSPVGGAGSSPRGRGKRHPRIRLGVPAGLIPAWAGKTLVIACASSVSKAHPRVGGENILDSTEVYSGIGSSPRGRGKHFLTCAFIERIGQILETLELAVSSESYSLSAAYATDALQDRVRSIDLAPPSSRGASSGSGHRSRQASTDHPRSGRPGPARYAPDRP